MPNPIDPLDNTNSIHNIGNFIMQYEARQNAFLNALVNRIGMVLVTSKMWNNPWAMFKRGYMEFGETVEEVFVNIAKPFSFDPQAAETTLYKREIPDVRAAFHQMNFQKYYKVTISNDQLRQAFLSWQGITDLIAKIVDSMYTAMQKDEFVTMKYMLCRAALNGDLYVESSPEATTENMKEMVAGFRAMSSKLTFLSSLYNKARVENATDRNDQYIIISSDLEAQVDVEVLAAAFHMDKADFLGHLVIVDSFSEHDQTRLQELFGDDPDYTYFNGTEITALQNINAIILDREWFMIFDMFQQMTQNYNGQGLYWQYFLHTWKLFSFSPFANAVAFTSQTSEITQVTVTPATANVTQGSDLMMTATVTGTGLISKAVTWSIKKGGATELAAGTTIDPTSGRLHVAADETVDNTITVTATAVDGDTGTATIKVKAASE